MQFYKPAQGDTAATVAEGYDRNFQHLENSKVDSVDDAGLMTDAEREKLAGIDEGANAYVHPESHSADMITDAAEKVVMTTSEREKLAGIDEGANAYVHPESHSADMITDAAEKVVMTTSEREKLAGIDEEANAYVLPVATAEVLGGIKIGDGLEVAEDGTLSAPGGTNIPPITDAPPVEQLTPADRLLAFDTDGNPLTATAQQLKEYATEGLASSEEMAAALAGKADRNGNDTEAFSANNLRTNYLAFTAHDTSNHMNLGRGDAISAAFAANDVVIYNESPKGAVRMVSASEPVFTPSNDLSIKHKLWHSGNFNPATKMPLGDYTGDLNAVEGSGVFRLTGDQSNAPFSGSGTGSTLVQYKWDSRAAFQIYYRFLSNEVYMREKTGGFWGSWVRFYHSGNFDPSEYLKFLGMSVDISESLLGMGFQYDTGGSGTTGPFISGGHPRYPLQLVCGYWGGNGGNHNLKFRTRNGDTGQWNPWYTVYSTGNLTPATAASVGLMSAEDKIKLNAVASAMSLSEDEPATMALNQEESVSSEISIRAQRSARYQMQTDELLYDALEAFARNHPEYTEFAEWIAAKDRIRAELAKPETLNLE